ncbi:hypothetical protein ACWTU6_28000 [Mesorhizobium sp. BHbsci]
MNTNAVNAGPLREGDQVRIAIQFQTLPNAGNQRVVPVSALANGLDNPT